MFIFFLIFWYYNIEFVIIKLGFDFYLLNVSKDDFLKNDPQILTKIIHTKTLASIRTREYSTTRVTLRHEIFSKVIRVPNHFELYILHVLYVQIHFIWAIALCRLLLWILGGFPLGHVLGIPVGVAAAYVFICWGT